MSAATTQNFIKATISADYDSSMDPGTTKPLEISSKQPDGVVVAQTICETINTADCNAFDNPAFATECGLALDVGTKSDGTPHTGGLYFDSGSRERQKLNKNIIDGKDYNTYTPTLGTSKVFATDKNMCLRKQVDLKCKQGHVIGEGNDLATCSLCFSDGSYHATIPNTTASPVTMTILSNANNQLAIHITSADFVPGEKLNFFERLFNAKKLINNVKSVTKLQNPFQNKKSSYLDSIFSEESEESTGREEWISLVSDNRIIQQPSGTVQTSDGTTLSIYNTRPFTLNESDNIEIICLNENKQNAMVAGVLKASTANKQKYQIDMTAFLSKDNGLQPLQNGTVSSYFLFVQQEGVDRIKLSGVAPFTFTNSPNPDSNNCPTGPFVTQAASMTALNADGDCYNNENGPGNYPLACLQKIFKGVGGNANGTGYPNATTKDQLLRDPQGNPRTLGQITDYLSGLAVQTATGLNNGVSMTLPDWNKASMFMTGKAITNACETSGRGFVTTECINFLYNDSGTYGNSVTPNESLDNQDFEDTRVCRPEGALSPSNPDGLMRAKAAAAKGGKQGVKDLFKAAFQKANNTSLSNNDRKQALKDCYGAKVLSSKAEVFSVSTGSGGYNVAYTDAPALCAKVGAVLATTAQLNAAQTAGSQVCGCGWTADDQIAKYPMVQANVPGCGSPGSSGLVKYVKLSGGTDWINLSQIVIKDQNGYNVAPNGTTSSSGVGFDGAERKAIDGVQMARPHPSLYHSSSQNAFFQVALAQPTKLSSVTIYNRSDCCQSRMVGYKVSLLDANKNVLFTSSPLTADNVQTISINLPTSSLVTCGDMKSWTGGKAAVYCYGPKPDKDSVPQNVKVGDWSQTLRNIPDGWSGLNNVITKWSQYS